MDTDKKRIWIKGRLIEAPEEVYAAYMKGDRKMRYFETDLKTEKVILDENGEVRQVIPSREDSLDRLMDDRAEQFAARQESVEDTVLRMVSLQELHRALKKLDEKEYALISAIYFKGETEREYAAEIGVYRSAVHAKKLRILKKLKKFLE